MKKKTKVTYVPGRRYEWRGDPPGWYEILSPEGVETTIYGTPLLWVTADKERTEAENNGKRYEGGESMGESPCFEHETKDLINAAYLSSKEKETNEEEN